MVESFEDQYPSVNVAYERAMASYQSMTERLESANQRIDSLLQLTITLTLAVPIAIGSLIEEPEFESPYALAAAVAFVLFLVTGFVARSLLGGLMLIDPASCTTNRCTCPKPSSRLGRSTGRESTSATTARLSGERRGRATR